MFPGFQPFDIPVSADLKIHGIRAGSGPPLLLLHGFPQTHIIWHKVAEQLASKYTVVIIDLRGYGASSKPASPADASDHSLYAKKAMAADCAAVMQHLGHASYFVCSHDRGARVAHKLMVDYPQQVRKCILLDICPTKAMFEQTDMFFARTYWHWFFLIQPAPFPETLMLTNAETFARKTVAGLMEADQEDVFGAEAFAAYVQQLRDPDAVHAMCEDYRAGAQEDLADAAEDIAAGRVIQCPVRILWGKLGLIEKKYDAKSEWAKVSKDGMVDGGSGRLDCGHFIPEEQPEELLRHILEFLVD